MSYAAKHYVKIFGRKYTPGEMIDIPIPEEKLKRLLRLKAIEHVSVTAANPTYDNTSGEDGNGVKDVRSNYAGQLENLGYDPSGAPVSEDGEPTEEADEEAEAPEIDVMDGIVSAAGEPTEEAHPKKTTSKGRKKA